MIYRFKSTVTADLIMLGPHGDRMLRLIGREPADKGIIEAADMPAALAALQAAVAADEQPEPEDEEDRGPLPVGLRQRLWPVIDMLRRCQAAGEPVVWGV